MDVARSDDYTVGLWLTNWYTLYAKPNVRVSTAEHYRRSMELYVNPHIGDIKLYKLTGCGKEIYQKYREPTRAVKTQPLLVPSSLYQRLTNLPCKGEFKGFSNHLTLLLFDMRNPKIPE